MAIVQLNDAQQSHTAYMQAANFRDQEIGMFPFTYWLAYAFDYSDIEASLVKVIIPPGAIVLKVGFQVSEAFTGVTSITVGDGSGVGTEDDWIADAYMSGGTGFVTDRTAAFAATGKRYNTGDTIDVTFGGVTSWAAGSGKVFVEIISYTEALTGT